MTFSPKVLQILQTAQLFQGMQSGVLVRSLSKSGLRTLNTGETLLVPGQDNYIVYVILSGRLSIRLDDPHAEPIAMLGEGECVGEMSILGDVHGLTYVTAATDCELLAVGHNELWELIDISHQAAHNALKVLGARIRPVTQAVAENLEHHNGFSCAPIVDELTGLYNRQWIEEKIDRYLRRAALNSRPSCLMMLEIYQLKEFTDGYGQLGGEQALRDTAHIMLSCLRPDDQAGYLGGGRFAVFTPNTSLADGCVAAERLRVSVSGSMVVLPSGDALPPVSISLGVSQANLGDTPASLFARVEEVLQQAIENGGNCVKWWDKDMDHSSVQSPASPEVSANPNTVSPVKPFMALWPDADTR